MEQLNRIEIRGYVGSVVSHKSGDKNMLRFTVATSVAYKDKDGAAVIDTTWHQVVAFESRNSTELERLAKGSKVYVCGRMRNNRFIGNDGVERNTIEVLASKVQILPDEDAFACEM